jgi:hypothetical protein
MKEDVTGVISNIMRVTIIGYNILVRNSKDINQLEVAINRKIILKCISKK